MGIQKNIDVENILGRNTIKLNNNAIDTLIQGQTVLVTGAGGSIGSELCKQILKYNPKKLLMLDIYENTLYTLELDLKNRFPNIEILSVIANIREKKRLDNIFNTHKPYLVFHAAAHKHVPLMEDNPLESVKNNVFGTKNLIDVSQKYNVKKFIFISTDKAVNPTSVYGATKRIGEMLTQTANQNSETEFVAVRFGNVIGSNGSVIPIFRRQIAEGGPVTVTHKNIKRFFMTIPESVALILQATTFAKGGEIFVLDMGKPIKILSLAEQLITLSGLEPYKDIQIEITGLRPGEKLYEELILDLSNCTKTNHRKIFVEKPIEISTELLDNTLKALDKFVQKENSDKAEIQNILHKIIPTYEY